MLSLSIADTKTFMAKLLKSECFDAFAFHSAVIHSFACFEISKIPANEPSTWQNMRHYAFEIIKGSALPKYIKIVLSKSGDVVGVPDTIFFVNVLYEDGCINISTGVSQKTFSLDKSANIRWDEYVLNLLDGAGIEHSNRFVS